MESMGEEITLSPLPPMPKSHGKRSKTHSTSGLDQFQNVYAEPSAHEENISDRVSEPEAMARFVSPKQRRVPVVIGARDQESGRKNSGAGASRVSIPGSVEESNSVNREQEHRHHNRVKSFRRSMSRDYQHSTKPAIALQGSDSFNRRTKPTMASDARVGAIIMIIILLCFVLYGRLCAILFACACLYLLPKFREDSESMTEMNRNNDIRMVYLQSNEYKKKVIMDGFTDRTHK